MVGRIRTLTGFRSFEALTALRLGIGLRTFTLVVVMIVLTGGVVLTGASVVVMTLARAAVETGPLSVQQVWSALLLIVCYTALGAYLRENLTEERYVVSRSANLPLFRALDIGHRDIFVVYRAIPLCVAAAAAATPVAAAAVVLPPRSMVEAFASVATVAALLAGWLAVLGSAARNASPAAGPGRAQIAVILVALAAAFAAGWIAGVSIGGSGPPAVDLGLATRPGVLAGIATGITVVAVAGCAWLVTGWARMASQPLPLVVPGWVAAGPSRLPASAPLEAHTARALLLHARSTWQATAARNTLLLLLAAVVLLSAMALAGTPAADVAARAPVGAPLDTRTTVIWFAFFLSSAVAELATSSMGPARMALHLRLAWELGASAARLAVAGVFVIVVAPAVAGTLAAAAVVTGGGPLVLEAVAVAVAFAAGLVVADSTLHVPVNSDGTSVTTSFSFLLALVLTLPVVAAAWASYPLRGLAVTALTALLVLGAVLCLRSRILTHPSSSTMSLPGTSPANPSSAGTPSPLVGVV